jgi:hypothetical protein
VPYTWSKNAKGCPASKPFAVMNQTAPGKPGTTVVPGGCHRTKAEAFKHLRALYAHLSDTRAVAEIDRELARLEAHRATDVVAGLLRHAR